MFDWDDQEIANIIWDEADDHIVPYPEDSEKKPLQALPDPDNNELTVEAANSKPSEQMTSAYKINLHGGKSEDDEGLSSLSTSKLDDNCIAKKSDLEKVLEISEDRHEDGDLGEIVGNSWANIGSFDDLDQILNNNDLVANASLDNTDELWSSSRDVIGGLTKSSSALGSTSWGLEPLDNSSDPFKFNTGYPHDENQSLPSGYGKEAYSTSFSQCSGLDHDKTALESAEKNMPESHISPRKIGSTASVNKGNWYESELKQDLGAENISDRRLLEDVYGAWPPPSQLLQHCNTRTLQAAPESYPSPVVGQQNLPSQSLFYDHFSNSYALSYGNGIVNAQDQYNTSGPVQLPIKAGSSKMGSVKKSKNAVTKPVKMTPQEKIEKLRRRQQMRAMLAIQKQQQQLTHPVSLADYSHAQKSSVENLPQNSERTDVEADENVKTSSYDPNSPLKQDESGPVPGEVDDNNVEDTVLYQLQDMVAKLDMKIRLCIKDSLYRLAQSAMQRHYASDSRSEIYEHNALKEDLNNHERVVKIPSTETQTNHIDRAVAHLLFHRPFKQSRKAAGAPETLTSTKIPPKLETWPSTGSSMISLVKNSENGRSITPRGSNAPPFPEAEQELESVPLTDIHMDRKTK